MSMWADPLHKPDHRTHEQRILAVLEAIRDEMILLRGDVQHLYTAQTAGAPQTPTIDTEPVLGLARKPGSAIVKPKGRR